MQTWLAGWLMASAKAAAAAASISKAKHLPLSLSSGSTLCLRALPPIFRTYVCSQQRDLERERRRWLGTPSN
jgi:hypothetical protein